jgi:hypothetical protein
MADNRQQKVNTAILPVHSMNYPYANINMPTQLAVLFADAFAAFYPEEGAVPSPMAMATATISLLNNVLDPIDVMGHGLMESALKQAGIALTIRTVQTPEDVREVAHHPRVARFFDMFPGHNLELFQHHIDQPLILMGVILLAMGKQVNAESHIGWITNRIRSFRGSLGIIDEYCVWTQDQYPSQMALSALNAFMSASFELRRSVFNCCLAACRSPDRHAAVFRTVVQLLQGIEMNHILMVSSYIFNKYPELLRIRVLRDNLNSVNAAMTYLTTVPEDSVLYVKLLRPREETAILNRNNFSLLASAAYAVAQVEVASIKYYRGGNQEGIGATLTNVIRQYLSFRLENAFMSIAESPYAYLSQTEKEAMMKYHADTHKVIKGIPQVHPVLSLQ